MPKGVDVSSAYQSMLWHTLNENSLVQVTKVDKPVVNGDVNTYLQTHHHFMFYRFPDGRTGEWWVQNRLDALLKPKGEYYHRLRRNGQWHHILKVLKGMRDGSIARWNSNRQILTLFDTKDLHVSRAPTPPCLITLQPLPIKDKLSLIATFRAQYTDAKGYGNLLSLTYLQLEICNRTGFQPDQLISVAHKPILKYKLAIARDLLKAIGG